MKKDEPKAPEDDATEVTAAELDVLSRVGESIDANEPFVIENNTVANTPGVGVVILEPHALDLAALDSKLVVVLVDGKPKAVLVTPTTNATPLPVGDPAHKLPEGAKILKTTVAAHLKHLAQHDPRERIAAASTLQAWAGDLYVGEQLSAQEWHHPLYTATAAEAIAGFVAHFHRGFSDPDAPTLSMDV